MENSNLFEKIESIPLFETIDVFTRRDDEPHVEQDHFKAVVEKGENDAIAVPTERYNLVQIRDVFKEALETVEEAAEKEYDDVTVSGNVHYYRGRGELEVFLDGGKKPGVGLLVRNSVDGSYALHVDFCTKIDGDTILVPDTEAFLRYHSAKNADVEVEDYFFLLSRVSRAWEEIATELGGKTLSPEDLEELSEDLHLGTKFEEKIENYAENGNFSPIKFWGFVQMALRHIQRKNYKSDMHYREKVRRTADVIMKWAVVEVL